MYKEWQKSPWQMYQRALVSMAKGTEAIAYIGAFGIVAFGNNGICLHSGKCQKRQRIAGNREKGIWDSGESHSSVLTDAGPKVKAWRPQK